MEVESDTGSQDTYGEDFVVELQNDEGGKVWNLKCEETKKPRVGHSFSDLKSAYEFYKEYGRTCGFDIRRSSQKTDKMGNITKKYFLCSNAGFSDGFLNRIKASNLNPDYMGDDDDIDSANIFVESQPRKRRTVSIKCGCPAKMVIKSVSINGFVVQKFNEEHNHPLVSEDGRQFLRCSRSLTAAHKRFIMDCAKSNIGPTRAHSIFKEMVGSYSNVGATAVDFKNFARDIKDYIGLHDADMIIQKFKDKASIDKSFQFEYQTDSRNHLTRLFWADGIGRRSYDVFGDVVSFDATYRTNKYNMVFVPFIGIDNHGKSVTFAAALLDKEDVENFKWVCEAFKRIMGQPPKCIITDQCAAMKIAIPSSFPLTKHRLCMWHIMKKFPAKLGTLFCAKSPFMDRLNSIVWNEHISTYGFEDGWNAVISEFDLTDNIWLSEMFELRASWIPAYFNDDPMAGLLRTTSRSESSNFYFNHFVQKGDTLSEFYLCYESAIEKQRNTNAKLNRFDLLMPRLVQEEIIAGSGDIEIQGMNFVDGVKTFLVKDPLYKNQVFKIYVNLETRDIECSCKLFTRVGYMCNHCFFCLGICCIHNIPRQYLMNRWLKNAEERFSTLQLGELSDPTSNEDKKRVKIKDCWFEFQACISEASCNSHLLDDVYDDLKAIRKRIKCSDLKGKNLLDNGVIEELIGSKVVEDVSILPPHKSNNKGCRKRIISGAEKSLGGKKRQMRECKTCYETGFHDSRNCPNKNLQNAA